MDSNCDLFSIGNENSYLETGGTTKTNVDFYSMLNLSIQLVKKGKIRFRYQKDTRTEFKIFNNGVFKFYINYWQFINDDSLNPNWVEGK
jgi:hypothetical protein